MMIKKMVTASSESLQSKIFTVRKQHVVVDRDLAKLYGVETRVLNQAVKRNIERFPSRFMFQMSTDEMQNWKSQIVISNSELKGIRRRPYVFTEQGVAMLSSVLKSRKAIDVSIRIMDAFIELRKIVISHGELLPRLARIEKKQLELQIEHDQKFEKVFKALELQEISPTQGIFFDGQIFDAYKFANDLVRKAKQSIVLIDNYVDDTVLTILSKRNKEVSCIIFTRKITKQLQLDLAKHNEQYSEIKIKELKTSHDRFMILDEKHVYHIGASLKDLGKKWFAFSKMEKHGLRILDKI